MGAFKRALKTELFRRSYGNANYRPQHWHYSCSVIRDTQRPWSFVQDLCRDEIRGWWWWWWYNNANSTISHYGKTRLDAVSEAGDHATVTGGQVSTGLNARLIYHWLLYQLWRLIQLGRHRWHQLYLAQIHKSHHQQTDSVNDNKYKCNIALPVLTYATFICLAKSIGFRCQHILRFYVPGLFS